MKTPVAFLVFKRPDTTERVFEVIRQTKPPKLLLVADGPRANHDGEIAKCEAVRAIIEQVDWDCEVIKNYSETNLGCAKRISSGLNWVFEQVEEAIILEDDCLPHPSFFQFCEDLLDKYRYDERIASISGQNIQTGHKRVGYDYYFSRYNHIWGWATWRRAWQHYDFEMKLWPEIKTKQFLKDILGEDKAVKTWTKIFQNMYNGNKYNTWDFQWQFSCWMRHSLGITSNVNLISNIGFGEGSTHVSGNKNKHANLPVEAVQFPLKHPPYVICDVKADNFTQKDLFSSLNPNLLQRLVWKFQ